MWIVVVVDIAVDSTWFGNVPSRGSTGMVLTCYWTCSGQWCCFSGWWRFVRGLE